AKSHALLLAEAEDPQGQHARSLLRTPEGYTLTAMTSLEIARRILEEDAARPGFHTPGGLFGPDFILEFDGCERRDLE
ncbi:MAG: saccharopine dehydrogenase, partial [Alphaproteobacteria bacterium]